MSWSEFISHLSRDCEQNFWTDGDEIYCKTSEQSNIVANFIESILNVQCGTSYYDPIEDKRNEEVDERTGWWAIYIV